MQHQSRDGLLGELLPDDLKIAEAVEGEVRRQDLFPAREDERIFACRLAQIFRVEVSLLIEHFGMTQRDGLSALALHFQRDKAREVLPEIEDILPLRRMKGRDRL